ncbi:hypothetical protein BH10ACI2_BH10ACI2_14670 [soil metagenome]
MSVIADVEELALALPASDRGKLAEKLIRSLPSPGWDDDDDGIEEALRRSKELDENREMAITIEQLDEKIRKRFPFIDN